MSEPMHLQRATGSSVSGCGWGAGMAAMTFDPAKVTCASCKRTVVFRARQAAAFGKPVHDENCCMNGVRPGSGPHPDCPGKREAARQFTEDRRAMERE